MAVTEPPTAYSTPPPSPHTAPLVGVDLAPLLAQNTDSTSGVFVPGVPPQVAQAEQYMPLLSARVADVERKRGAREGQAKRRGKRCRIVAPILGLKTY